MQGGPRQTSGWCDFERDEGSGGSPSAKLPSTSGCTKPYLLSVGTGPLLPGTGATDGNDCRMTRRRAIMLECAMQLHVRTCTASCRSSTSSQTGAVANRCQLGHRSNRNTIESVDFCDFDSRRPWARGVFPRVLPRKSSSSLPFIPHPRSLDSSLRCGLLLSRAVPRLRPPGENSMVRGSYTVWWRAVSVEPRAYLDSKSFSILPLVTGLVVRACEA